jgi:hypothetical protein
VIAEAFDEPELEAQDTPLDPSSRAGVDESVADALTDSTPATPEERPRRGSEEAA